MSQFRPLHPQTVSLRVDRWEGGAGECRRNHTSTLWRFLLLGLIVDFDSKKPSRNWCCSPGWSWVGAVAQTPLALRTIGVRRTQGVCAGCGEQSSAFGKGAGLLKLFAELSAALTSPVWSQGTLCC